MRYRDVQRKEEERGLAREYLTFKSAAPRRIQVLREFCPDFASLGIQGPDVRALCDWNGREITVGVEVTKYQVDGDKATGSGKGSASIRAVKIWDLIQHRLEKKHFPEHPGLASLNVSVSLDTVNLPRQQACPTLADQIFDFLQEHVPTIGKEAHFCRHGRRPNDGCFESYPMLKEFVRRISVWRRDCRLANRVWRTDAAHIGVVREEIIAIIDSKAVRCRNYDFSGMNESWLLICATGETSSSRAGRDHTGRATLESPALCAHAAAAGFDRVIFWDRVEPWDFDYSQALSRR